MALCLLQVVEVEGQLTELFQRNRSLQVENDEIPILRDSIEEMRYLESKVVCVWCGCVYVCVVCGAGGVCVCGVVWVWCGCVCVCVCGWVGVVCVHFGLP